jgi:hypothetical protein
MDDITYWIYLVKFAPLISIDDIRSMHAEFAWAKFNEYTKDDDFGRKGDIILYFERQDGLFYSKSLQISINKNDGKCEAYASIDPASF